MRLLCIDTGNTTTHYGVVEDREVSRNGGLPTASLLEPGGELDSVVAGLARKVDGLAYCSVVPSANAVIEATARTHNLPVHHLTRHSCGGLRIAYPDPAEIGEDRLANALAAKALFGSPAVVIDMGTAVTFDILGPDGAYEGGIIAPGLELMSRYLHEQTALLPRLAEGDMGEPGSAIGKSTVEAMQIGCVTGFAGMVRGLLAALRDDLAKRGEPPPALIATGGSTLRLPADLSGELSLVPGLTLIGLSEAFEKQ